jgi:hypothetical protein
MLNRDSSASGTGIADVDSGMAATADGATTARGAAGGLLSRGPRTSAKRPVPECVFAGG